MLDVILRETFRDWANNYLTFDKFAEHNGIDTQTARVIIAIGRELHEKHCEFTRDIK